MVLELFSQHLHGRRRWDAIGEPVPSAGCLFAYRIPKTEIEEERRFAAEALGFEEMTTVWRGEVLRNDKSA